MFRGVEVNRSALSILHLIFIDYLMVFREATTDNLEKTKKILDIYSNWLGQVINYSKSSIFLQTTFWII